MRLFAVIVQIVWRPLGGSQSSDFAIDNPADVAATVQSSSAHMGIYYKIQRNFRGFYPARKAACLDPIQALCDE